MGTLRVLRLELRIERELALKTLNMTHRTQFLLGLGIGSVWIFHGLCSKILGLIPRHQMIVGRVLGENWAGPATVGVGVMEILLGIWAMSGRQRPACALVQTLVIAGMNTLEIWLARDLLISAPGMVVLNLGFLAVVWFWATSPART